MFPKLPHSNLCECCGKNPWSDLHHRFSQTKWAKRVYGAMIHDPRNLQKVCNGCHASHANPNLERWSEKEFCDALGIEMKSKVGMTRAL